jgi:hypothetical protein
MWEFKINILTRLPNLFLGPRALLENIIVAQQFKVFPVFEASGRLITAFTKPRYSTLT